MNASTPRLLHVVAPLFVESVLGLLVGLIGTYLASRISDTAAAAYGLSNQIWGFLFIMFRIIGAGISVVVAQHLGAGQRPSADAVARASIGGACWMGTALAILCVAGAGRLLEGMHASEPITRLAQPYLQCLGAVIILEAIGTALSGVLRAHFRVGEVMRAIVGMQLIHVLLALALVPRFGLMGYAMAMFVSRFAVLLAYAWLWHSRLRVGIARRDFWVWDWRWLRPVVAIGLPAAIENIGWMFGFIVSVRVATQLGEVALATHTYMFQIIIAVAIVSISIGLATEIMVGHAVGAGDFVRADRIVKKALAAGMLTSLCLAIVVAWLGRPILRVFTQNEDILILGAVLFWIGLVVEPGRAINIIMTQALRAASDAKFPAFVGLPSQLLVLGAGSWWLGVSLGLGLVGVWLAYALDEWLRGILNWARWHRKGWLPHAKQAHLQARGSASVQPDPL